MSEEDREDTPDRDEAQDSRKGYVRPSLTDIGSFQDLTQAGGSGAVDSEGHS